MRLVTLELGLLKLLRLAQTLKLLTVRERKSNAGLKKNSAAYKISQARSIL